MSVPLPSKELSGRCSAIHENVLYVLSPDSFQSLPLRENATWSELPKGPALDGPACVRAVPGDDASLAALYVIGGETDDGSYSGLSRFLFERGMWERLDTPANVMRNRTKHSAAYLNDTQSILVYAGSQPMAPSATSSQTFVIHTDDSHNIDSFTARAGLDTFAPAVSEPILEAWNSSHAVLLGGTESNEAVFLFEPASGWQQYGTSLSSPLASSTRGTIVTGSDGSKVLETYDMSTSPNKVAQLVLQNASGEPAPVGQTIGSSLRKRKRDLTLANWPEYNSTNAPTAIRTDYSMAADGQGKTVCAGGNVDSPLAMFDQTDNEWIDTSQFFNSKQQQPLRPASTDSGSNVPSATSSAVPSASTTSAADRNGDGSSSKERTLRTLGITLGVLCGIAAMFIAALLYMRWRKLKQKKQDGYIDEKDESQSKDRNRMSFVDRGASFMKEAGGSVNDLLAPSGKERNAGPTAGSHTSLTIIAGKLGANKYAGSNHAPKASYESTTRLVKDRNGNMEMMAIDPDSKTPTSAQRKPAPTSSLAPPPPNYDASVAKREADDTAHDRSSGWSKYFAANQPTGNSHLPSAYAKPHSSVSGSEYTTEAHSQPSRIPSSVLVPPLDIDFSRTVDGQRLSHVATGSPSFSHSREDLAKRGSTAEMAHGQSGMIESTVDRPNSKSTVGSELSSRLSGDYNNHSANTLWTPFGNTFKDHVNNHPDSRPTSSIYTNSLHESRMPSRGKSAGFFPGSGTSYRPPPLKTKMGHTANPGAEWAAPPRVGQVAQDRDSTATVFPAGVDNPQATSRPKELRRPDIQPPASSTLKPPDSRDSTATVFPSAFDRTETAAPFRELTKPVFAPPPPTALRPLDHRDSTATVFPSGDDQADQAVPLQATRKPEFAPHQPSGLRPSDNRDSSATNFPRGVPSAYYADRPQEPGRQAGPAPVKILPHSGVPAAADNRDSTATLFPRGVPSAYYANRPKELDKYDQSKPPMSEDMSWLNLGLGGNRI